MGFLARLLGLGDGKLPPSVRAELEAEGLVLVEEGLHGSVRFDHFKAPGRRLHGKVSEERIGLAISEGRFVAYCRSGRAKLVDNPFSDPRLRTVEITAQDDRLELLIDYDRLEVPETSGQVRIRARTEKAALIADELRARIAT